MKSLVRVGVAVSLLATVVFGSVTAGADNDRDKKEDHDKDDHRPPPPPPPPPPVTPSNVHGAHFLVKNGLDPSFCMDVAAGAAEGRSVTLSPCNAGDSERWDFTWNADGMNAIVDNQGMCVDIRGRHAGDGVAVAVYKCHFGENEKFSVSATGHIREVKTGKCLSVPRAGAGAAVFLEDCDEAKKQQVWTLAH